MERVQKLQNFAAKVAIGGARKKDHVTPILKKLEWMKMEMKCYYEVCIHVFKIKNNLLPDWLLSLPTVNERLRPSVTTRQKDNLYVPLTHTDTGGKAFDVRGPMAWNKLPENIKSSHNINSFKNNLKVFLMSK